MVRTMNREIEKQLAARAVELGRAGQAAGFGELQDLLLSPSAEVRRLAVSAIGMLEKQKLYQQTGKRLVSLRAREKPRLREVLR